MDGLGRQRESYRTDHRHQRKPAGCDESADREPLADRRQWGKAQRHGGGREENKRRARGVTGNTKERDKQVEREQQLKQITAEVKGREQRRGAERDDQRVEEERVAMAAVEVRQRPSLAHAHLSLTA